MKVLLDTIPKVQKFCTMANKSQNNIDAVSGKYKVDGKSLLGLLSLNLSNPIDIIFENNDGELAKNIFYEFGVTEQ